VDNAPELATEVNVAGTQNLLEALTSRPPLLFLFASSAAVYPDRRGPIDETSPAEPIDLYGRTKLQAERLVTEFAARSGARATVARIFNVIGKRETNPHVVPEVVHQLRQGSVRVRVGNVSPRRDYTDVRDVADALQRLCASITGPSAVFNVGSGRSVSVDELIQVCEQILGRGIEVEVDEHRLRSQDRAELVADARRLRQATGWRPERSLRETLTELLTEGDDIE
jgi:UDP-glucose 4-epimerase